MSHYFNQNDLDVLATSTEYAEFIMDNGDGSRVICNGNTLTLAMEDLYLFDRFVSHLEDTMECGEAYEFIRSLT